MLYQKLLVENNAYLLSVSNAADFENHRHPEIELNYCLQGTYVIEVDSNRCSVNKGDLVVINTMVAHEIFQNEAAPASVLTIELGPSFLKDHFSTAANLDFDIAVFHLNDRKATSPEIAPLKKLLEDAAQHQESDTAFSDLTAKGNLYHISAILLQELHKNYTTDASKRIVQDITKIEKSVRFIYDNYSQPLDLDQVSQLCGYSKSHFCRVFKSIVGDTFHNVLSRHRIEIACLQLKESNASVESIAGQVGFADAKNFCRVFKKITGVSPNGYRKSIRPRESI